MHVEIEHPVRNHQLMSLSQFLKLSQGSFHSTKSTMFPCVSESQDCGVLPQLPGNKQHLHNEHVFSLIFSVIRRSTGCPPKEADL